MPRLHDRLCGADRDAHGHDRVQDDGNRAADGDPYCGLGSTVSRYIPRLGGGRLEVGRGRGWKAGVSGKGGTGKVASLHWGGWFWPALREIVLFVLFCLPLDIHLSVHIW